LAERERTSTVGVFKRGDRYSILYQDATGRVRSESARTYDEARRLRATRVASVADGTHQPQTRERFATYATAWVERYRGNGGRGFTEHTRAEYRRDLRRYAIPRLGNLRLEQITPRHIAELIAWLCDEREQGKRAAEERRAELRKRGVPPSSLPLTITPLYLADATVRRALSPLRACLRTATAEGLIRHNPTVGAALPARDEARRIARSEDEIEADHDARALSDAQLATFLAVVPARHKLLFELLAATGLRISEAMALRCGDLTLDGSAPAVHVRRAYVKGTFKPPKSRYGKRAVPIDFALVRKLRQARGERSERELVFTNGAGHPLEYPNLLRRVLKPAAEEAGVPWMGFHPCATPGPRACSRRAATPSRCSAGSVTTPPPSRSACTCTCSTVTSAGRCQLRQKWQMKWQPHPQQAPATPRTRDSETPRKDCVSRTDPHSSATPPPHHNPRVGGSSPSSGTRNSEQIAGFVSRTLGPVEKCVPDVSRNRHGRHADGA
jgi:integrase